MLTRNTNMEIYMENISPKLFTRREMLDLVILSYNISYTCSIISYFLPGSQCNFSLPSAMVVN